jgi:hypothetical protein
MGVSGDDMASHRRNSGKGKELIGFRRSVTMRIGLKYLTSALAAGAAAVAIAAAPAALAAPTAAEPAVNAAAPAAIAGHVVPVGHGGGFHGGGFHGGGWGGDRGGWHGDRGWGGAWWPWGWYR